MDYNTDYKPENALSYIVGTGSTYLRKGELRTDAEAEKPKFDYLDH